MQLGDVVHAARPSDPGATLELVAKGDRVDRLAAIVERERGPEEDRVALRVEVLRNEHLAHRGHGVAIDEDPAEHRLLGVVVVRRHPHRRPGPRHGRVAHELGVRDGRHWAATTTLSVSLTSG